MTNDLDIGRLGSKLPRRAWRYRLTDLEDPTVHVVREGRPVWFSRVALATEMAALSRLSRPIRDILAPLRILLGGTV